PSLHDALPICRRFPSKVHLSRQDQRLPLSEVEIRLDFVNVLYVFLNRVIVSHLPAFLVRCISLTPDLQLAPERTIRLEFACKEVLRYGTDSCPRLNPIGGFL